MIQFSGVEVVLNQFIPYRVVNLARRMSDSCAESYREEFDISAPEWRVLAHLAEVEEQNSRDIGDIAVMNKSKVSRAVNALFGRGLLAKRKDADDQRVTYLSLTDSGRALYQAIALRALDWEKQLISALDAHEYRDFMRVLTKLDSRLTEMGVAGRNEGAMEDLETAS